MRFGIDPARFGAEFRHHRLDFAELVGRILVENMQHAIARRAKKHAGAGIECVRIHSSRNGVGS